MQAKHDDGFSIGKLDGLTWGEVEGYAAEVSREDGDVYYRGHYLCTVYNDEDGGDQLGADGNPMTDEQVQAEIGRIDSDECDPGGR